MPKETSQRHKELTTEQLKLKLSPALIVMQMLNSRNH
jgi:hypothetical protein